MDLKPILYWFYFIPIFSSSILNLLITILLTSHKLILSPLTLSTVCHRRPPFFAADYHSDHHCLPLTTIAVATAYHRLLLIATIGCHWLPSSTTVCHYPPPLPPHPPPLPSLATTVFHHPSCQLLPSIIVDRHSPLD